jgi:hypothetical protein
VRSLYPVMRAISRGPCPLLVRSWSCSVPGDSGSGGGGSGIPRGRAGRGVAVCCEPDVVGAGGVPGGDGADGQPGADERVQVFGADAVGVGAGPGDAGGPVERGFPGDGLVDACLGEQRVPDGPDLAAVI